MTETTDLLPGSARKVAEAAAALGLAITIRIHSQSTRTAEEAAAACGCDVGAIVKSLVFCGATSGKAYILLVSGRNRVNEKGVAGQLGEALRRPDADEARRLTGFAIGGIPPFGHASAMETIFDPALLEHAEVWAAAGTPSAVFAAAPAALLAATGARVMPVSR